MSASPARTQLAHPTRLVHLLDVHPYSNPSAHLCTDDGDFVFVSEGGSLAFFDHRAVDVTTVAGGTSPYDLELNPAEIKRRLASNIRAIAVDKIDADEVMVYIGVSRMGIVSIPFQAGTQPNNGPGFNVGSAHLIKTPGEVWGLEVRPGPGGVVEDRVLLCCDSYGGMRIYGQGLILSNDGETTEEEDQ